VKVPEVVGLSCSDATAKLQQSHLQADCQDAASDTAPAGQVFSQSPSAGQETPQGGTVTLEVSTGPAQVPVPDVTNSDYPTAKKQLHDLGLKAVQSPCLPSDATTPDGTVVATDPPAGTSVDPGSPVTVYVADSTATTACP
jgi:beta-lactam-binding protein with PASTA domain